MPLADIFKKRPVYRSFSQFTEKRQERVSSFLGSKAISRMKRSSNPSNGSDPKMVRTYLL